MQLTLERELALKWNLKSLAFEMNALRFRGSNTINHRYQWYFNAPLVASFRIYFIVIFVHFKAHQKLINLRR